MQLTAAAVMPPVERAARLPAGAAGAGAADADVARSGSFVVESIPGFGDVMLRRLRAEDSLDQLTDLLHRAYAPLARAGFRFHASWQDVDVTRRRITSGECWIAELEGRLVATGTLHVPGSAKGTPWYEQPGVAVVGQFAVEPSLQRRGVGTALLMHLESRAREAGAAHMALDTAEGATHLVHYYERLGFRFVEYVQWDVTNYRSVVLSKPIAGGPADTARS